MAPFVSTPHKAMSWWHRQHERLHLVHARSARRQGPPRDPFPNTAVRFDMTERVAKRARTASRTVAGAPKRTLGVMPVGGEISQSYFVHNRHGSDMVRRKIDTFVGPMIDQIDAGKCLASTVGVQEAFNLFYMGDFDDIDRLRGLTMTAYPEAESTDAAERAMWETGLLYLNDMDSTTEYCNMANVICWFTIYDLLKSGSDRLNVAVDEANTFDPKSVWEAGVDEQRVDGAPYNAQILSKSIVGAVPTDSHRFGQEWHIMSHTRVALSPGSVHQHHVRLGINSFINWSDIRRSNLGETAFTKIVDYLKGTTYAQLVVLHGCPCPNTAGDEATFSRADLCAITHKRFKWRYATGQAQFRSGFSFLDTSTTAQVTNPETGKAEGYDAANPL